MTIRVLIADDHTLLRAGLRTLLNRETDFTVVGEASDGNEAINLAKELQPDVVLMDISMPGYGGIEATRTLRNELPDTHVLVLTFHEDESLLQEALRAGASGYIVKRAFESELINAIKAVTRGDLYVHPAMARALLGPPIERQEKNLNPTAILTPREIEVLRLLANGYTNQQIADTLSISVRTVETHRSHLTTKINLHSRSELVRYAIENALL